MGFNVLKDPSDPRNFIITPAPTGQLDPNLLAAGQQAGQSSGVIGRPAARARFGGARGTEGGEAQFGPGSEEAFTQGLINLRGRLNRKRFEQNKAVFEANLARDGLDMNQEGLRGALDEAYKATNGFQVATEVARDFFFNQPAQQLQRDQDLKVQKDKQTREANIQIETLTKLRDENEVFRFDQGVPAQKVVDDRESFNQRMTLAGRVRDAQVLSDHFGSVRFGESTSSEKAAVKQAYADIKRELTIGIGQASEAGALSDEERDFFGEFAGQFGTLSPIQDSTRRVALGDAYNFLAAGAEGIKDANRALSRGARPAIWDTPTRTVDQILSRELPEGLNELTPQEIAVEATRAENLAAGTLGPITDQPAPDLEIFDPEGGRAAPTAPAAPAFFEGIEQFLTTPETDEDTVERLRRSRGR